MNDYDMIDNDALDPYVFFALFYEIHDNPVIVVRSLDAIFYPAYQQCRQFLHVTRLQDAFSFCQGISDASAMILFLGDTDLCRLQDLSTIVNQSKPITVLSLSTKRKWVVNEDGWIQRADEGEDIQVLSDISGIPLMTIQTYDDMLSLEWPQGPVFIDVVCSLCSPHPIGSPDHALEDMFPQISEEQLYHNMVIEPIRRTECMTAT
jgi:hypothetical protein